jgi:prophage regulatory protein
MHAPERLLTIAQVCDRVSFSRMSVYRLMRRGQFPSCIRISPHRVAWRETEISAWIADRIEASAK